MHKINAKKMIYTLYNNFVLSLLNILQLVFINLLIASIIYIPYCFLDRMVSLPANVAGSETTVIQNSHDNLSPNQSIHFPTPSTAALTPSLTQSTIGVYSEIA